jgi:hypothetical protein
MRDLMSRVGGRKLVGFASCLIAGGVLIYLGKLDNTAAAYLAGLYAAFVGSNAATHIAQAVGGFRGKQEVGP